LILLLGGARSGKSATAVRLASGAGLPVTFIATAEPGDDEMAGRIDRHRAERPSRWTTLEAPVELLAAVASAKETEALVVDCLTLWVSNLLGRGWASADVLAEAGRLAEALRPRRAVVVSNEVGLGIVPANELARQFRDTLGSVNATFAAAASRSLLLVAGHALPLVSLDDSVAPE
jgi:adenosyl cobinamide kinase/adenosyl cobinamide phosphate guanylyltransferase